MTEIKNGLNSDNESKNRCGCPDKDFTSETEVGNENNSDDHYYENEYDSLSCDPQTSDRQKHKQLVGQLWLDSCNALDATIASNQDIADDFELRSLSCSNLFESVAATGKGGRKENQDTAAVSMTDKGLLLIVCDGMGGGPAGKRASFLAAHTISSYIANYNGNAEFRQLLTDAIMLAHNVIILDSTRYPENSGMGTTAAVVLINENQATFAHVGDSRIYQIRQGKVIFRTIDHSLVARKMLIEGWTDEEARTSKYTNIITQAVGNGEIEPECIVRPFIKGDRFLICSDGIWGLFPQNMLVDIISSAPNVGGAISNLMVTADNIGISEGCHHDNFTAVILSTNINSKLKDKMMIRLKKIIWVLASLLLASLLLNVYALIRVHQDQEDVSDVTSVTSAINVMEDSVTTAN